MFKKQISILILMAVVLLFSGFGTAFGAKTYPAWVLTKYFVPPNDAKMATEKFSGTLSFSNADMNMQTTPEGNMIKNPWAWWGIFDFIAKQDPEGAVPLFELDANLFPGLDVDFFTADNGDLVPVERGIIRKPIKDRTTSFWELIVGPGKVWKASDNLEKWSGWNKAAFPFSLVQSQEGEAILGLGFFYYKGDQVSKLYFQISNDTGGGFIFWDNKWDVTGWGTAEMEYIAGTIIDEHILQEDYLYERAKQLPMKPLASFRSASGIGGDIDFGNVLTTAIVKDDVIYYSPVKTPFGEYPYLYGMRAGVWSMTKSLIPGIAALRLAEKYGPGFLYTKLVDYFKEGEEFEYIDAASKARWEMVTIEDALNMKSGMGPIDYNQNWAMESVNSYQWGYTYHLADQIRYYFNQSPNPEVTGPGQKMAYIDQDMWAATLAMERFLQNIEGPDATILNMLSEEVYKPIGVDYFVTGTGYTESNELGFPYSGWGAIMTLDYLAKAGKLIANMGMSDGGQQILKKDLIKDFFTNAEYQLAFWKTSYKKENGKEYFIPTMSGAGGNNVYAMPNGMVGIALGYDSYDHGWSDDQRRTIVDAANKIKPFK